MCVFEGGGGGGEGFTAKTLELMTLYVGFLKNFLRCLVTLNHSRCCCPISLILSPHLAGSLASGRSPGEIGNFFTTEILR